MIIFEHINKSYRTPKGIHRVLEDVSFTIPSHQKIGIMGSNGAGKSTLLNLISGSQTPDSGRITRFERMSWPLGFSGGMNASLTGLENCTFVARIYGRSEREVIAYVRDFSELGRHFNLPVRTYSSGMRARLAFGLSMAFDFGCYLIDEIISVGDFGFQEKCRAAFRERHSRAGLILVSHSPELIAEYCDKIAIMHHRALHFFDDLQKGFDFYNDVWRREHELQSMAAS